MNVQLSDEEIRKIAKARVGFRIHALVYAAVNLFLVALWALTTYFDEEVAAASTGPAEFWPVWPLVGWGLGLLIHGFVVYGGGLEWERREEAKRRRKLPPGARQSER